MQTRQMNQHLATIDKRSKNYENRLLIAALCIAVIFLMKYTLYAGTTPNSLWDEVKDWGLYAVPVLLSSVAFICLLPVLVRGRPMQRIKAVVLSVMAVCFAFQYWGMIIEDYVING